MKHYSQNMSNFGRSRISSEPKMNKILAKWGKVTAKRPKKHKTSPLMVAEKHRVQMYRYFLWPTNHAENIAYYFCHQPERQRKRKSTARRTS